MLSSDSVELLLNMNVKKTLSHVPRRFSCQRQFQVITKFNYF